MSFAQGGSPLLMSKKSVNESNFCKRQGCKYVTTLALGDLKAYSYVFGYENPTITSLFVQRKVQTQQIDSAFVTVSKPRGSTSFSAAERKFLNDYLQSFIGESWTQQMSAKCLQLPAGWYTKSTTANNVKYRLSCKPEGGSVSVYIQAL